MVKKLHGKIVSENKVTLDNGPGREVVIEATDKSGNDVIVKVRAFLVRNQLYQVMAVAPRGELSTPAVSDFHDSFRLLTK